MKKEMKRAKTMYTVCAVRDDWNAAEKDVVTIIHIRSYSLIHLVDDLPCKAKEVCGVWDEYIPDEVVLAWYHLMSTNKTFLLPGNENV